MNPQTNMINGSILDEKTFDEIINSSLSYNCDFLMATPPCQGISQAGKMKEDDPRNKLIIKVVEAIHLIKPNYFLIENVQRMPETYIIVNNKKTKIKDFLENELSDEYNINIDVLNAKDFGTPQSRKKIICNRKS